MATPKNENHKPNGKNALKARLRNATDVFEDALKGSRVQRAKYILRLYVTGSSTRSLRAISNLKKLCDEHLSDEYELEVIDIYKNPHVAREEQIVAAPTLIKRLPRPLRRFVGDMSNTQKLLVGLDIYQRQEPNDQLGGGH
jgi:circadian clock protein KaiB